MPKDKTVPSDGPAVGTSSSGSQQPSWRSLFGSNTKLQYFNPMVENGKKTVSIAKETHDLGVSLWEDCLVGQFLGPSPRLAQIIGTINNLWRLRGQIDVIDLGSEAFPSRFGNLHINTWVLNGGPWYISNRHILLQQWSPKFSKERLSTS